MHSVGDIIYVISNKKRQIFPVRIVEQVIRKTLSGEDVTYKVQVPGNDKIAPVDLHSLDGTSHKSLSQVRTFLYEQATSAIEIMLRTAQDLASTFTSAPDAHVTQTASGQDLSTVNKMKVKLEDGTSATVTIPVLE